MPTWFKIKAKERRCIAKVLDNDIVNVPVLEWIDYPTQVDLEQKRIIHFQPLIIEDESTVGENTVVSATFIQWSDGSGSYVNYHYDDFRAKVLPKYNELINRLDYKMRVADIIVSDMTHEEIEEMLKPPSGNAEENAE